MASPGLALFLAKGSYSPSIANDAHRGGPPPVLAWHKKWTFRILAATVLPVLFFFFIVEASLHWLSYGFPTNFLLPIPGQGACTSNPKFSHRFFSHSLSRCPHDLTFLPDEKAPHAYRIFVVGGSAAYGVPCTSFSIGHILEVMLRDTFPEARFEVVNAAVTATNSHVALQVTRECCQHDADLVVVYMAITKSSGRIVPVRYSRLFHRVCQRSVVAYG